MKIYSIRPRLMIDDREISFDRTFDGPREVYESVESIPTGILDERGNMIYSSNNVGPIGFGRS